MELTLNKLKSYGITYNIKKSLFVQTKNEYLCFGAMNESVSTVDKGQNIFKILIFQLLESEHVSS